MKKRNLVIILIIVILAIIVAGFAINMVYQKNKEYEIAQISEYKYFAVKEDDKIGVINTSGKKIINTEYDSVVIPNPEKAVFICTKDNNTKVLNENGEEIYTDYQNIKPLRLKDVASDLVYEKTTLEYEKNGKFGIISIDGEKITEPIYESIDTLQFKEGELLVKLNGKYGVINIKGATIVKPLYDSIESDKYYESGINYKKSGYIVSKTTNEGYRYGYVNYKGKQILDTKFNDLSRITDVNSEDVYLICAENGQYGLIKNKKKVINNEYQSLNYNESNNTVTALKGKRYGVVSLDGKVIVPFEYIQIDTTGEYIYATTEDSSVKTFDANGKESQIDSNLAIVDVENTNYKIYINSGNDKTEYTIYKDGKAITKNEYTYIEYLYDNYFIACNTDGELGVIDDAENVKIPFNYNSIQKIDGTNLIQTYQNDNKIIEVYSKDMKKIVGLENAELDKLTDYIKIYNDDEVKYVTNEGKEVKNTELFSNNKIFANKWNGKWGFVDKQGNKVVDYEYDKVTEVNSYGFAGIEKDGKWGVVDSNGKILVEPKYTLNENNPVFIGEYYQVKYGNGEIYFTNLENL